MATSNTLTVTVDGKDNLSGELKNIESKVIRFVGAVSSALTAISVIAFPIMESARFQRELLETAKTTNYTKDQIEVLKTGLVDLSRQVNITAVDLAKIATMGGQLGVGGDGRTGALATFVEEVARAVTALDIPAEEAVTSLGKLINIFDIPAEKFRNVISALNEVSNVSNATASQLFDVVRRIGNLGGAVDVQGAAALSAAMIDLGLTAETAGTTITKIFADMRSKAGEFATFIGGAMTEDKWVNMLQGNGLEALDMFLDRLNELPASAAAAAQMSMVGGGRIFEATIKLRQQRLKAIELENLASEKSLALEREQASMTADQVKAEQQYIKFLKEQAVQANVVSRLNNAANDAYKSGISAMREQQTVLSGLQAQWRVFLNNVSATAMGMGDSLLIPITEFLQRTSRMMAEADFATSLSTGVLEVVEGFRQASSWADYFFGGLKDFASGIDVGQLLPIAALWAAAGAFKLLTFGVSAFYARTLTVLPGVQRLSTALFGMTAAAREAQAAAAALQATQAAASARSGSLFQAAAVAAGGLAARVQTVAQAESDLSRQQQARAAVTARITQQQAAAQQVFNTNTRSRLAIENALAQAQQRLASAQTAGNNRAISSNQRAVDGYQQRLNVLDTHERRIARLTALEQAWGAQASTTQRLIADTATRGVRMAQAFEQARVAGQGFASAVLTAWRTTSSPASAGFVTRIANGFTALQGQVSQFGRSVATSFAQAGAGATGLQRAVAGIGGAWREVGIQTYMASRSLAGIAGAGIGALASRIGAATLAAAGLGTAWDMTTNRLVRGSIVAAAAINLVGAAIRGVALLLTRLASGVFWAMLIKETLDFLGLWDSVLGAVRKVWTFFGGKEESLPSWLKTRAAVADVAKKTAQARVETQALAQAAANYGRNTAGALAQLADAESAVRKLSLSSASNLDPAGSVKESMGTIIASYSQLAKLREENASAEVVLAQRRLALMEAYTRAGSAKGGPNEAYASGVLRERQAAYDNLQEAIEKNRASIRLLERDTVAAADNTWRQIVRLADEMKGSSGEALREWGSAQAEVVRMQQALDAVMQERPAGARAPGDSGGQADTREFEADLLAKENALKRFQEAERKAREALFRKSPGNPAIVEAINELSKLNVAPLLEKITNDIGKSLDMGLSLDMGGAVRKLDANSLLEAGATIQVSTQLRNMYKEMASEAGAAADASKNLMTRSLEAQKQAAREAERTARDMVRNIQATQNAAKNFKGDQADDATLRERLNNLEIEKRKEEEVAQFRYGNNSRLLAQEMFSINEKYRRMQESEERVLALKRSQRDAGGQQAELQKLVDETNRWIAAIETANKVIKDPTRSIEQQAAAVRSRSEAEAKAKTAAEAAVRVAGELSRIAPIGDKFVIPVDKLKEMQDTVTALGPKIAESLVDGSDKITDVYTRVGDAYGKLAEDQNRMLAGAISVVKAYATQLELAWGAAARNGRSAIEETLATIASAMAQSGKYQATIDELGKTVAKIKMDPELFPAAAVNLQVDALRAKLATPGTTEWKFVANAAALQTSIVDALRLATTGTADAKVPVNVGAAPGALKAMEGQISSEVQPKIKIDVEANVRTHFANTGGGAAVGGARVNARGGFVEGYARGGAVQHYAGGGRVRGAGDGTSDSILSWLSNGEYVMDAMTTAKFGSKFFANLQALARGGTASSFLSRLQGVGMPRFALGGPVSAPFSGSIPAVDRVLSGGAAEASPGGRDVVEINFNSGGKKISLFAERQQATAFVQTLKNLEAGA